MVRGEGAIVHTRGRCKLSGQKHFGSAAFRAIAHAPDSSGRSAGKNILAANRFGCHQVALLPLGIPRVPALYHRYQCQEFGKRENRFRRRIVPKGSTNMFASIEELSSRLELATYAIHEVTLTFMLLAPKMRK